MNFKELTSGERNAVRQFMLDELRLRRADSLRRVNSALMNRRDHNAVVTELETLWDELTLALSNDFVVPEDVASKIEGMRKSAQQDDEAFGDCYDEKTERALLLRRIRNQRSALRALHRSIDWGLTSRIDESLRFHQFERSHAKRLLDQDEAALDVDTLRDRVGRQRHALKRAQRLIDAQQSELGRLLTRLVQHGATG